MSEVKYYHPDGTAYYAPSRWELIDTAPVSSQVPDRQVDMLVYDPRMEVSGPQFVAYWDRDRWVLAADGVTEVHPTHWMPLPEAPV